MLGGVVGNGALAGGGVGSIGASSWPMQGAGRPAISASGTSTVQRKPTQLRLYMQLTAKGKTLEDALAKLKERQEAATAQLETLKADKKSIVFGAPSMSNDQSSRRKQIQAMVIQQMRSRGKKVPKGLLDAADGHHLRRRSPPTGRWKTSRTRSCCCSSQASPGEDQGGRSGRQQGGGETLARGRGIRGRGEPDDQLNWRRGGAAARPAAVRVRRRACRRQERQKAMAEAFAKAKAQAAELAKAAGVELGPLVGLSGGCSGQSSSARTPMPATAPACPTSSAR